MGNDSVVISLQNVSKEFDGKYAVENFNLEVKKGEFVTFLGPSGCGKTTTLRMIAGFEMPTQGKIILNGQDITHVPPYQRPVNTVSNGMLFSNTLMCMTTSLSDSNSANILSKKSIKAAKKSPFPVN